MKNLKTVWFTTCVAWMLTLVLFSSCTNDDDTQTNATAPPVITSVLPSGYDLAGNLLPLTPVTKVDPKNYYIIRGTGLSSVSKVYFNDYETYFRPTFVTDTEIIVLVDENTPYANASNKLKVVTANGTVFYDLVVAPPSPTFTGFSPINATAGTEVTITGKYFLNPVVTLAATATKPAVPVTIVSSTLEKIVVKLPANADYRNLTVTNISGSATSKEAIGTALYDDVLHGVQWGGPWAGKGVNFDYDGDAYQGTKSWQWVHGGWDGGNWGFNVDMTPYKAFRIAVKGLKAGKVNFNINGGKNYELPITTTWTYIEIPLSYWDSPSSVWMLTFQESNSDGGNTILYDDLGFVLK